MNSPSLPTIHGDQNIPVTGSLTLTLVDPTIEAGQFLLTHGANFNGSDTAGTGTVETQDLGGGQLQISVYEPGATAEVDAHLLVVSTSGGSDGVTYTSKIAGAAGDNTTIQYLASGVGTVLGVSVTGTAITVQLAASPGSTNTAIAAAIAANAQANALVSTSVSVGGDENTAASGPTPLAGGVDANAKLSGRVRYVNWFAITK